MTSGAIRYVKGHGTQNDFVVLPDPDDELDLTAALVRALCDRRAGIGADGVLRVVPSAAVPEAARLARGATWFMDHRNADGSLAEMCGNGLRLFALYLVRSGLAEVGEQRIGTRSGVRTAVVQRDGLVRVEMGQATVAGTSAARVGTREYAGTAVYTGNPHLVCPTTTPVNELDLTRPPTVDAGLFPDRVNVEFVNLLDDPVDGAASHVRIRVHERGVGETAGCGTGACAVTAVVMAGSEGTVAVDQPGGRVLVTIDRSGAVLSGPAVIVGTGELDPTWLSASTA